MVKGTTRQVIVVKATDTRLFEQAIFLLKEDALEKHGVTERQLLEEAKRLSENCTQSKPSAFRGVHRLPPLAWSGLGAALTGAAWLLTAL
ncbi:MAG: translation initiation factor 2 [Oscillospiraceae bacterium]|nr:translation initiation factor 2 [Oscillospiraceae bacterium]